MHVVVFEIPLQEEICDFVMSVAVLGEPVIRSLALE